MVLHSVSEVDLLVSVRERYTTVKRLVVRSASPPSGLPVGGQQQQHQHPAVDRNVLVEVQFTGPQPSEGPGALLCDLLCGSSVEAKPVELPRGRKKRARTDAASSEASDSGASFRFFPSSLVFRYVHDVCLFVTSRYGQCVRVPHFKASPVCVRPASRVGVRYRWAA